jgi:hypothetical protein
MLIPLINSAQASYPHQSLLARWTFDPLERRHGDHDSFWRTPYDPYGGVKGAFPDLFRRERGEALLWFGVAPDAITMCVDRRRQEQESYSSGIASGS